MSLCDVCLEPGACCKRMSLTGPGDLYRASPHRAEAPMSYENAEHLVLRHRLPFVPSEQRPDGTWSFACTQLLDNGRCGIYETRPQLCRDYKPGEDKLCVHFWEDTRGKD